MEGKKELSLPIDNLNNLNEALQSNNLSPEEIKEYLPYIQEAINKLKKLEEQATEIDTNNNIATLEADIKLKQKIETNNGTNIGSVFINQSTNTYNITINIPSHQTEQEEESAEETTGTEETGNVENPTTNTVSQSATRVDATTNTTPQETDNSQITATESVTTTQTGTQENPSTNTQTITSNENISSTQSTNTTEQPQIEQKTEQVQTKIETPASTPETDPSTLSTDQALRNFETALESIQSVQPTDNRILLNTAQMEALANMSQYYNVLNTREQSQHEERFDYTQLAARVGDSKKEIKKRTKMANKLAKEQESKLKYYKKNADAIARLDNAMNRNNYQINRAAYFENIRQQLGEGAYIHAHLQSIEERAPLILDLCKNHKKLKNNVPYVLSYNGRNVEVYQEGFLQGARDNAQYFGTLGGNRSNAVIDFLTNNTRMSESQARSAWSIGSTLAIGTGIFLLGRRFFTEKDESGKRHFKMSLGKVAAAVGIPLIANWTSQGFTGKGILDNLNEFLATGKLSAFDTKEPTQAAYVGQNLSEFALMNVPYPALSSCCKPDSGKVTSVDLDQLINFYDQQIEIEKAKTDGNINIIRRLETQKAAIESIKNDPDQKRIFDETITRMNLKQEDLKNPSNESKTLDNVLAKNRENVDLLFNYTQSNGLRIKEDKKSALWEKVFGKDKLSTKDFDKLLEEGVLEPDNPNYDEINKLDNSIPHKKKLEYFDAFKKFAKNTEYKDMKLQYINNTAIKVFSDGKELEFNPTKQTLPDFVDNSGQEIIFKTPEDLLNTVLFINYLRKEYRGETPKAENTSTTGTRPFNISDGTISKLRENIEFQKISGNTTIISDAVPIFSTMDTKFPTIEDGENRKLFVNYLNKLWKQEHS